MKDNVRFGIKLMLIGGIGFVIWKSYKTYKEEQEAKKEIITMDEVLEEKNEKQAKKKAEEVEQLKEELNEKMSPVTKSRSERIREARESANMHDFKEPNEDLIYDAIEAKVTSEVTSDAYHENEYPNEDYEYYMKLANGEIEEVDEADTRGYLNERSGEKLRHDPNSKEAMAQYKLMILSDYESVADSYDTLQRLWDYSFVPINPRDAIVNDHIFEERARFFGDDSKFVKDDFATMAELFIFWVNKLSWDYDVDIAETMQEVLTLAELDPTIGETDLSDILSSLEAHNYVSKSGRYGLFGLTLDDFNEDIKNYPGVIIETNSDIGFDMEYNVFCDNYGDEFVEGLDE